MKPINLLSLRQTFETCITNPELFEKYLRNFEMKLEKQQEKEDLIRFIDVIGERIEDHAKLNDFYIGYRIPQISKEFDLLRLGKNYHLNIEIKHSKNIHDINKQMMRNRYYLLALNPFVWVFTYVVDTGEVFFINESSAEISPTTVDNLVYIIQEQQFETPKEINELFSPRKYLVSPLNSPEKFINKNYFLTDQQEAIKRRIIEAFDKEQIKCALITGSAGTGKTLLTYDIAHHYIQQKQQVCVIHCGKLSDGHIQLIHDFGWNVYEIKHYFTALKTVEDGGVVVIDEAQRIFQTQIPDLLSMIFAIKARCIFSFDPRQFISPRESQASFIDNLNVPYEQFTLSDKIRTNKEIASFIHNLFDKSKINTDPNFHYKNIYLQYFEDKKSLKHFLEHLKLNENWQVLNYTTSIYAITSFDAYQDPENKNAHDVIGQEFDKVAVVINEYFYYENGKLMSHRHPARYQMNQMLYQNLTRTREKLYIVIYKNMELLTTCLEILNRENVKKTTVTVS